MLIKITIIVRLQFILIYIKKINKSSDINKILLPDSKQVSKNNTRLLLLGVESDYMYMCFMFMGGHLERGEVK